ncbi:ABC-type transport system related with cytochrome c biogenesis, permease component [Anaerolinea thermolimosa]|uniref:cytochrome c biogenesis protein n=1 Tax=Anaerolinea thermolimosa TaxID=229919 RepID=UPI0007809F00|nr:cytochrome c biogenesis protein CcsA [Anaerolinea thermolimosa]GAP07614.1 ABC-type transport system related with cytochrome c biogenesis, permease component [Anaerolinea thermolimosa]
MKSQPRLLIGLDVVTVLVMAVATYMVFGYAPIERVMGAVQKVFYFHVAAGWVGMLGFLAAVVAGVAYLVSRKPVWDLVGLGAIEIGLTFMLINIITGSIWARPIWNTWWTWDPRLTTATIMELLYAAYLMLRQGIEDPERRARFGAVYAIIGFISVPLTFFSIRIYRTIHPVVIGGGDPTVSGSFSMTPAMGATFAVSLVAFSFLFASLLWHRIRLGQLGARVEQMKLKLTE